MRRLVGDPWFWPVLFAAAGIVFLVAGGTPPQDFVVIAAGLVSLWMGWRSLPQLRVRSRPLAGAEAHVAAGGVVVFWRPGCPHCAALITALAPEQRAAAYWVNIWTDPAAADDAARARLADMLRDARPAGDGTR